MTSLCTPCSGRTAWGREGEVRQKEKSPLVLLFMDSNAFGGITHYEWEGAGPCGHVSMGLRQRDWNRRSSTPTGLGLNVTWRRGRRGRTRWGWHLYSRLSKNFTSAPYGGAEAFRCFRTNQTGLISVHSGDKQPLPGMEERLELA